MSNPTHAPLLRRNLCWAVLLGALFTPPLLAQVNTEPVPGDCRVVDSQVDAGTYAGWRLFHTTCYACHGRNQHGHRALQSRDEISPTAHALLQVGSFSQAFCGFETPSRVQSTSTKSMNPRSTLVATSLTRIR